MGVSLHSTEGASNPRRRGYSLRKSLQDQGVSDSDIPSHITFVYHMLKAVPVDITKYRAAGDPRSVYHG